MQKVYDGLADAKFNAAKMVLDKVVIKQ